MPEATPQSSSPKSIVEAVRIGRRKPATDEWLLREVSIQVRPGERTAIAGPTGSGKTLLLRSLALLDSLDEGEVRWRGAVVSRGRVPLFRSRVIYLHQRPALVEGTVLENLRLPQEFRVHRDKSFDRERILCRLNALGRDADFFDKKTADLSGGEAQIAALLRAMQLEPDVLLLDEPTAALDRRAVESVEQLVAAWLSEKPHERATVWVSHDAEQARRVSDVVLQMREGRLEE